MFWDTTQEIIHSILLIEKSMIIDHDVEYDYDFIKKSIILTVGFFWRKGLKYYWWFYFLHCAFFVNLKFLQWKWISLTTTLNIKRP